MGLGEVELLWKWELAWILKVLFYGIHSEKFGNVKRSIIVKEPSTNLRLLGLKAVDKGLYSSINSNVCLCPGPI